MIPFFAMSMRASDAAYTRLDCLVATIVVVLMFVAVAFVRKSALVSLVGAIFGFVAGVALGTWSAFFPAPLTVNTFLGDPEFLDWQAYFRLVSIAWVAVLFAAFVVYWRLRPERRSFPASLPPV